MFEPTNDLLSCDDGLGKFFFSDLNTKFCFSRFKLVHTLFSRIVANSHLDSIYEILYSFFHFRKLLAQTRKNGIFSSLNFHYSICNGIDRLIIFNDFLDFLD